MDTRAPAGRTPPLHALGLRGPQRRPLPAALDGTSRRRRRAHLLRQQHVEPVRHVGGAAGARLHEGDGDRGAAPRDVRRQRRPHRHAQGHRRRTADHAPHARGTLPGVGGTARVCPAKAGGPRLRLRAEEILGGRHRRPEPEQDSNHPGEAVAGPHVQVALAAFRDDVPRLLFV